MPNLNLDIDYFDHPKTKRLIRLLGKGSEVLPLKLWVYTARYFSMDGRLTGISAQEIEDECRWWGNKGAMVDAMVQCGFLDLITEDQSGDVAAEGYTVHDWEDHEGHISAFSDRAKKGASARWDRYRSDASSNASSITPSNAPTLPTKPTIPNHPEEPPNPRKRGRDSPDAKPEKPEDLPIPDALAGNSSFIQAWSDFIGYRREMGKSKKLTPIGARQALAKLAEFGPAKATQALRNSMANGWQGIFEPDQPKGQNGNAKSKYAPEPGRLQENLAL